VGPPDESARKQIINEHLTTLGATPDSTESASIIRRAAEVVNATPAILISLCDRLHAVMVGRASARSEGTGPAVEVRQKPLDDAVSEARHTVTDMKDSMESCAAKWIERNRKEGLLHPGKRLGNPQNGCPNQSINQSFFYSGLSHLNHCEVH